MLKTNLPYKATDLLIVWFYKLAFSVKLFCVLVMKKML